jgi:hypothetical protein
LITLGDNDRSNLPVAIGQIVMAADSRVSRQGDLVPQTREIANEKDSIPPNAPYDSSSF